MRQTVNSGYDPQANGLAERWIGIVKVHATALLADVRLPPDYWSYACRWVAYVHTHRVTEIPINKALPHFGDFVVIHHAFKKPPSLENRGSTGVCLGHDTRIAGGVLVVSVVNGELKEVCSAKVRKLGERVGQAWRLHVHPQDDTEKIPKKGCSRACAKGPAPTAVSTISCQSGTSSGVPKGVTAKGRSYA